MGRGFGLVVSFLALHFDDPANALSLFERYEN